MSEPDDRLLAMGARYKPTVNIGAAPPPGLPLPFVGLGWLFLLALAILLFTAPGPVAEGWWGLPEVVLAVHVFTLGFLSLTMMGLLYQWVPVVFDVAPVPLAWGFGQSAIYLMGLLVFLDGWATDSRRLVAAGGGGLAAAIVLFTALIGGRLGTSHRQPDWVTRGVTVALAGFNATWVLGLLMAFSFLGLPGIRPTHWLYDHILTASVAWVGTLVMSVQLKIGPMFAMARSENDREVALPFILVWAGLGLSWVLGPASRVHWLPDLLLAGAGASTLQLLRRWRRHSQAPTPDRVLWPAQMGWMLWTAAGLLLIWSPVLGFLSFAAGALTLVLGYQTRIVPFITALAVAHRLPGPPFKAFFLARALGSPWAPVSAAAGPVVLGCLLAVGILDRSPDWVAAGGLVLALTVVLHGGLILTQLAAGRRQGMSRPPAVGTSHPDES
jgi:hypothetical protein